MAKLNDIDKAAESKGSFLVTVWQFVKFIVVSLGAMIVQFVLLNTLQLIPAIKDLYAQDFSWWVFVYPVAIGGLGYFIVSNVANIIAQIVAFFINKEKTFNSGANIAVALPIYIVFTIALICFSAWLNPTLKEVFVNAEWFVNLVADIDVEEALNELGITSAVTFDKLKELVLNEQQADSIETAAKNIATMICSAVQFFLYFPVDKILFHKKKEEKAE